ncbi:MAG: hypothetical protein AAB567_03080 [Patescibacteria group bacterium]
MKSLVFICDYGEDSLATGEVLAAIQKNARAPFPVFVLAARPLNTIHTGFLLDQMQRNLEREMADSIVFFLNTDPRTHTKEPILQGNGAPLFAAKLANGALVLSPNAGHCLSFVKDKISSLRIISLPEAKTQFRSRDLFSSFVAKALLGELEESAGSPVSLEEIPGLPKEPFIVHIDNYGNIKISYSLAEKERDRIQWGDKVKVRMGEREAEAQAAPSIFAVPPGTLAFAPGSSGDPQNPYFELSLRFQGTLRQSAAKVFGWPEPGDNIEIQK